MIISILGGAEKFVACALPSREAAPRAYDLRGDARADSSMDRRFNEAVQNAVNTQRGCYSECFHFQESHHFQKCDKAVGGQRA
jgi:hypothetical protein